MTASTETRYAVCVLQRPDGAILLLKRAPDRPFGAGLWGFIGGHIEPGESPRDCALRELAEEIGIDHKISFIREAGPVRDPHYGGRVEVHLFLFHWHEGRIELNAEHTKYDWIDINSMHGYRLMPSIEEDLIHLTLLKL